MRWLARVCDTHLHNVWIMGVIAGVVSTVLDNFATSLSFFSLYSVVDNPEANSYVAHFAQNGYYWKMFKKCSSNLCRNSWFMCRSLYCFS